MRGKLIVIDGTDGSGKATQAALLLRRLKREGFKVRLEDFPQYGKKSAGLVEDYLNGSYGASKDLGPYAPSIFYAIDRFAASTRIREYLKKGYVVVANRYVTSNLAHQGGKIANAKKRHKFFQWAFDLEYRLFKLPQPDLTLILNIPASVALKLVDRRKARRAYLRARKRDIHEADPRHLREAERTYLEIAKKFGYPIIKCYQNGGLLSRAEVAELVWEKVKRVL